MSASHSQRELLTPTMIKAARSLLSLEQTHLASLTGVSRKTIAAIETSKSNNVDPRRRAVLESVRRRLEEEFSVVFTFADASTGEGVRIAKPFPPGVSDQRLPLPSFEDR